MTVENDSVYVNFVVQGDNIKYYDYKPFFKYICLHLDVAATTYDPGRHFLMSGDYEWPDTEAPDQDRCAKFRSIFKNTCETYFMRYVNVMESPVWGHYGMAYVHY